MLLCLIVLDALMKKIVHKNFILASLAKFIEKAFN